MTRKCVGVCSPAVAHHAQRQHVRVTPGWRILRGVLSCGCSVLDGGCARRSCGALWHQQPTCLDSFSSQKQGHSLELGPTQHTPPHTSRGHRQLYNAQSREPTERVPPFQTPPTRMRATNCAHALQQWDPTSRDRACDDRHTSFIHSKHCGATAVSRAAGTLLIIVIVFQVPRVSICRVVRINGEAVVRSELELVAHDLECATNKGNKQHTQVTYTIT